MTDKKIMLFKLLSPLHMGSGTDLGIVDMPIQRERHTGFPKMESSGIKGSIKRAFENLLSQIEITNAESSKIQDKSKLKEVLLGPENADEHASKIGIADGKILFYPVKSAKGIFAYITCPYVLNRYSRDTGIGIEYINTDLEEGKALVIKDKKSREDIHECIISSDKAKAVILEEYKFIAEEKEEFNKLVKHLNDIEKNINDNNTGDSNEKHIQKKLIILSDNDFKDLVTITTEINTRIKIGKYGIVEQGQLFTEEYLPMETILYSVCFDTGVELKNDEECALSKFNALDVFAKAINNKIIQMGGNTTLGKGFVNICIIDTDI